MLPRTTPFLLTDETAAPLAVTALKAVWSTVVIWLAVVSTVCKEGIGCQMLLLVCYN